MEYWIVDWRQQEIEIYRYQEGALGCDRKLSKNDDLTSETLPNFICSLLEIFV